MSSSNLRQAETLLARFPGPVSLHLRRRNKRVALSLCLGSALFLAWLLFADPDFRSRYRSYDPVMIPIGIIFFGAFGVRAAIMLLVPSVGSLTLDATGFAHNATLPDHSPVLAGGRRLPLQPGIHSRQERGDVSPGHVRGDPRQCVARYRNQGHPRGA